MESKLESFLEYLTFVKKYSKNTIDSYEKDLYEYESYIESTKKNYLNILYNDVTEYTIHLNKLNLSASSINRHLSAIRSFYEYLIKEDIANSNPFKLIKGPKKEKRLPNYLQYQEFEDLISVCDTEPLGVRNRMILELLFATGIRVSEAISIKLEDINFKEREIKILGKGKKTRIVYFNKVCQAVMSDYVLNARQTLLKGKSCEYLLINHLGNTLTRRGVADILDKLIMKSSIKHKISPHVMRHTFATQMLNNGMDIREVQELLGHEKLSTTSIYTHVSNEELRKVYLAAHPRAHKSDVIVDKV